MAEPRIRTQDERGESTDDRSTEWLLQAIAELDTRKDSFLIVGWVADGSGNTFVQLFSDQKGSYTLEYRYGGPDSHFRAEGADLATAQRIVTEWAAGKTGWGDNVPWRKL